MTGLGLCTKSQQTSPISIRRYATTNKDLQSAITDNGNAKRFNIRYRQNPTPMSGLSGCECKRDSAQPSRKRSR
jgi:hypothetical protein